MKSVEDEIKALLESSVSDEDLVRAIMEDGWTPGKNFGKGWGNTQDYKIRSNQGAAQKVGRHLLDKGSKGLYKAAGRLYNKISDLNDEYKGNPPPAVKKRQAQELRRLVAQRLQGDFEAWEVRSNGGEHAADSVTPDTFLKFLHDEYGYDGTQIVNKIVGHFDTIDAERQAEQPGQAKKPWAAPKADASAPGKKPGAEANEPTGATQNEPDAAEKPADKGQDDKQAANGKGADKQYPDTNAPHGSLQSTLDRYDTDKGVKPSRPARIAPDDSMPANQGKAAAKPAQTQTPATPPTPVQKANPQTLMFDPANASASGTANSGLVTNIEKTASGSEMRTYLDGSKRLVRKPEQEALVAPGQPGHPMAGKQPKQESVDLSKSFSQIFEEAELHEADAQRGNKFAQMFFRSMTDFIAAKAERGINFVRDGRISDAAPAPQSPQGKAQAPGAAPAGNVAPQGRSKPTPMADPDLNHMEQRGEDLTRALRRYGIDMAESRNVMPHIIEAAKKAQSANDLIPLLEDKVARRVILAIAAVTLGKLNG